MVVLDILILIGIVSYVLYKLNRSGLVGQQGPQSSAQKNVSVKKKSVSGNPKGENFKRRATKFVENCTKDTGDILGDLQDEYHRAPNPDGPQHKYVDYTKPGNNPFEV